MGEIIAPASVPQELFLNSDDVDICFYGGSAGGGKALLHGEKVLTPAGFISIEDCFPGMSIIAPDNSIQKVTHVFPQGEVDIYEVLFQDGRKIKCSGDHLWKFHKAGKGTSKVVSSTLEIKKYIDEELRRGGRKYLPIVELVTPIDFRKEYTLKIKPYTLGVLLGDGCLRGDCVSFTSVDLEVVAGVNMDGYPTKHWQSGQGIAFRVDNVKSHLVAYDLYMKSSIDKFIPKDYFESSIEDRYALIQGLMDTDGYVTKDGKTYFYTISQQLCSDIKTILYSLGFTVTVSRKKAGYKKDGKYIMCNDVYCLYIRGKGQENLFRLRRKKNRAVSKNVGIRIEGIEYVGKGFATCISVTGNHLFVTSDFIVTHNSFASLMHHLKWVNDPNYRGLTLRRTTPMLLKPGAIWDEAKTLYRQADPKCQIKIKDLKFVMSSGAEIAFSHFEQADATDNFQGSQLSSVVFDELTHFEESQFLYLLSRLRTKANMKPVARATMNPDPNSWVRKWVDWYLYPKDHELFGRPNPEKQGKIRWFVRDNNEMVWGNSKEELLELYPKSTPLSFRMIFATAYDNPYIEPTYIAFLEGLPRVEKEILLHGNWEARAESSGYWKREWVEVINLPPTRAIQKVRAWDISGTLPSDTNPNPDWTVGTLMSKDKNSIYYVEDVVRDRRRYGGVFDLILETARRDGLDTKIVIPRDPGAAGQAYAADIIRQLAEYGFSAKARPTNKSKVQRFAPFASLCEAGGVRLVRGDWNDAYMMELERFDGSRNVKDDQVDSSADAFTELASNIHIPDFLPEDLSRSNPFKIN